MLLFSLLTHLFPSRSHSYPPKASSSSLSLWLNPPLPSWVLRKYPSKLLRMSSLKAKRLLSVWQARNIFAKKRGTTSWQESDKHPLPCRPRFQIGPWQFF
ncbi:hypothetical protein I7I53_06884 [Histoplasma capsulatum var. duboisii H88]|uniref:Uncharacterized protein n=1 Tax=Ajellomyces capsulatus (strain H88) TaxID=544711 RepID=A0A8A1LGG2_AJEC8|nr:hypothetical protein I7I53_06884 [Histoplasma capsulatum var. duboisii H88]